MSDLILRRATADDLDDLEALEMHAFESDRLSRRSFRWFISSPADALIVVERHGHILGYALVLFRRGAALARLYSIAVSPDAEGQGIGRALLRAGEQAAEERGALFLRLEVRADNTHAIAFYMAAGYRQFGRYIDYYQDHMDALRFEKRLLHHAAHVSNPPPYFEQTLDFTCGPACLMMALAWADPSLRPNRVLELRLWREATTIFMTSGLGGCEPFGMAVTLAKRGLKPEIRVNHPGPFFIEGVRSEEKRIVMRLTQEEFRREAEELDIPVHREPVPTANLIRTFDEGGIAIVLVSGYRMFRKKAPHWLLAHGHDERHIFVHDPWIEEEELETSSAAANLPIPVAEFDRMARYGSDNLRAAIFIRKGSGNGG